MSRIGAIDIGTNTLLLLVAESRDGELIRVHDEARFGRLGKGLDATGAITSDTIERCLEIARDYAATMNRIGVDRRAAVGTQTLREATNAADFIGPAQEALGCDIEVIAGEREAELVHLAVSRAFPELAAGAFAIADVGGGSTEIIIGGPEGVRSRTSLPIGSVRFAERHLRDDPPTPEQVRAMIADIDDALAVIDLPVGAPLVGTAGTATSIASVELRLREWDADRVNGCELTAAVVEKQLARHLELSVDERKSLPGLEPERADVIPAGVAIYARLLHRMESLRFITSDRGVRWGLAYELA